MATAQAINRIRSLIRAESICLADAIGILDSLSSAIAADVKRTGDHDAEKLVKWIDDAIEECEPFTPDHREVLQTMAWDQRRDDVKNETPNNAV